MRPRLRSAATLSAAHVEVGAVGTDRDAEWIEDACGVVSWQPLRSAVTQPICDSAPVDALRLSSTTRMAGKGVDVGEPAVGADRQVLGAIDVRAAGCRPRRGADAADRTEAVGNGIAGELGDVARAGCPAGLDVDVVAVGADATPTVSVIPATFVTLQPETADAGEAVLSRVCVSTPVFGLRSNSASSPLVAVRGHVHVLAVGRDSHPYGVSSPTAGLCWGSLSQPSPMQDWKVSAPVIVLRTPRRRCLPARSRHVLAVG